MRKYNAMVRMFDFASVISTPGLPTLISFVIGFGLACVFRPLCKGPECVILRGPPVSDVRGAVYQFGTKCVEFTPKALACPTGDGAKSIIDTMSFADISNN